MIGLLIYINYKHIWDCFYHIILCFVFTMVFVYLIFPPFLPSDELIGFSPYLFESCACYLYCFSDYTYNFKDTYVTIQFSKSLKFTFLVFTQKRQKY